MILPCMVCRSRLVCDGVMAVDYAYVLECCLCSLVLCNVYVLSEREWRCHRWVLSLTCADIPMRAGGVLVNEFFWKCRGRMWWNWFGVALSMLCLTCDGVNVLWYWNVWRCGSVRLLCVMFSIDVYVCVVLCVWCLATPRCLYICECRAWAMLEVSVPIHRSVYRRV